jgi:oxaloacetate decarboxylase gamma subunit
METDLFAQGLTLMLAGMGTVFVFLSTLVFAMTLMSSAIMRFRPRAPVVDVTDEELAAISAAISKHRNK